MKFLSGTRAAKMTYVVEAKRPMFDPTSGTRWFTDPLYAEFKQHKFDSEAAQRTYGWTDEQRKKVEEHLLNHQDWGRSDGRGIFLDQTATAKPTSEQELVEAAKARGTVPERRCLFMQDVGEDTIQCDQKIPIDQPSDYCSTHEAILEAATA